MATEAELAARLAAIEAAQSNLEYRVTALESASGNLPGIPGTPGNPSAPGTPALSALQAGQVTTGGAVLSATVEPRGLPYSWRFDYGLTTDYGSVAPLTPAASVAPVADIGSTTSLLRQGSLSGDRMKLAGIAVWGIGDTYATPSFADNLYANRAAVAATIKSWGANYARFRLYANDWNDANQAGKDAIIGKAVDWRNTFRNAGLLTCFCWWDSLDGPYAGPTWATEYDRSFEMMAEVAAAVGSDPYVLYQPWNEPNNISDGQWDTATRATTEHFRNTIGYKGLLIVATNVWSHGYDDTLMTGIEAHDAPLTGTGRANVAFARHDYGFEYPGYAWDEDKWEAETGGTAREHILIETEFGVFVFGSGVTTLGWGQDACVFFAARMQTQQNFCGACAFLFGNWSDDNATTTGDLSTTTTWGGYVKNDFLADAGATAVAAYGTTSGGDPTAPATQQQISAAITGLTPGTTYHYRARAANTVGTAATPDALFTTQATASTPTITNDHSFENTATGTGNDQVQYTGSSWTLCSGCVPSTPDSSFHYGYTPGDTMTLRFNGARLVLYAPNDTSGASAPVTVDGQPAGTAEFYHPDSGTRSNGVRFDTGPLGSANADHVVVVTIPSAGNTVALFDHAEVYRVTAGSPAVNPPAVTAGPATSITSTGAVLSGIVGPNGAATTWRFEYGTTTGYGSLAPVPDGSVPAGAAATVAATLSGLGTNTLYHYRLKATNNAGTTYTADGTFTTGTTATPAGRITRSGAQLRLAGAQYKAAGMNWLAAAGCGTTPTPAQLAQYFSELNPKSMTRILVLPGMSLTAYDAVFNAAKAAGQYLCVVLFNSAGICTTHSLGYGTPLSATEADWVQQVCSRHAGEPTVAVYECAHEGNESHANIAAWYAAVAARVKQYDPQALVGTGGGQAISNAAAIAALAASPFIDLISCHDATPPAGTLGPRVGVFNNASTSAGKPWYLGARTFGFGGGDTGNLATNGQRLTAEYGLHLGQANCAMYLYNGFSLAPAGTAEAGFGNALWAAARTYGQAPAPQPGTGFWLFGGSVNTNVESATNDWQAVMCGGRPVTAVLAYTYRDSWGMCTIGGSQLQAYTNKTRTAILQCSPFPEGGGYNYGALVNGAYDSYWAGLGSELLARENAGFPPVVVCVAWEMNGTYFYWGGPGASQGFSSSAQYRAGFQRIVGALRSTYPNVVTAFVINGHASNPQGDSWELYPGDSFVTFIGGDWYNHFDGNPQTQAAFDAEANDPDGIRWMLAKVRAAGPDARGRPKKLIVPEWGVDANHGTPADNANWVEWMFRVFQDAHSTGHMGPETYFNEAPGSVWDIYATKPNARARYQSLYSP